jgi:pyruvate dehydrogenase E1 component beta subunit
MPSTPAAILAMYRHAVHAYRGPVISLEHRLMYDLQFRMEDEALDGDGTPFRSRRARGGRDVTIVATSIMVLEAQRAAAHLARVAGIDCEIIDLNCVSHPDAALIVESVRRTGRLVIADTSWSAYGVCAEVARLVAERAPEALRVPVVSLAMQPAPCPTAKALEDRFYPNLRTFTDSVARLCTGHADHGIPLPDEHSMADVYKRFKGPF